MLPSFPNFKILELADRPLIERQVVDSLPYTESNFLSLLSYYGKECGVAQQFGNIVLRMYHHNTREDLITFLGTNRIEDTFAIIMKYCRLESPPTSLRYIPEETIVSLRKSDRSGILLTEFHIEEDRDDYDYVLDVEKIALLNGSAFGNHRNQINKFRRACPTQETILLDLKVNRIREEILLLFERWLSFRTQNKEYFYLERDALIRLLDVAKHFDLVSLGTYWQGRLIAFSIEEVVPNQYGVAHFGKAEPGIPGVYYNIEHESAKHLFSRGVRFLNFQDDCGEPGLRQAKKIWNPIRFLRKFTISPLRRSIPTQLKIESK